MRLDELEKRIYHEEITQFKKIEFLNREIRGLKQVIENIKETRVTEYRRGEYEEVIKKVGDKETSRKEIKYVRNPAKITLAYLGNIEFFCYPYSSTDKIFMRIGRKVQALDKYDLPKLMAIFNKGRWFVDNAKRVIKKEIESTSELAQTVRLAWQYSYELDMAQSRDNARRERLKLIEYVHGIRPVLKEKWFNDVEGLKEEYEEWVESKQNEVSDET